MAATFTNESLAMQIETETNVCDSCQNIFRGWFIAPATTNYRFWAAVDDYCDVRLGVDSPGEYDSEGLT